MLYLQAKAACREYRLKFSKAYKVLYPDQPDSLCFLTEILDSAQEGFPYLWVNSEKYSFTEKVLTSGAGLFEAFHHLLPSMTKSREEAC